MHVTRDAVEFSAHLTFVIKQYDVIHFAKLYALTLYLVFFAKHI